MKQVRLVTTCVYMCLYIYIYILMEKYNINTILYLYKVRHNKMHFNDFLLCLHLTNDKKLYTAHIDISRPPMK